MKHVIVYAHPNPKSFNAAILDTTVTTLQGQGHEVTVRDLYQLQFDPVLKGSDFEALQAGKALPDIAAEQSAIAQADVVTFIYPIWWAGLPAMIKGYIDRVFSYGFAYAYQDGAPAGLLTGKKALIINTQGTPEPYYDASGMTQAMKQTTDTGILAFCGIESLGHIFFGGVPSVDDAARKGMLEDLAGKLKTLF